MKGLSVHGLAVAKATRLTFDLDSGSHVLTAKRPAVFEALYPLLLGWERPRRGSVVIDGEEPYRSPLLRARLGAVLPVEVDVPAATGVKEYLELVQSTRVAAGAKPLEEHHRPLLDTLADRPIASLGAAERRRLALYVALNTPDPRLLLLHDPLSAIGSGQEEQLLAALTVRAKQGALLIFTTHDARTVRPFSAQVHELEPDVRQLSAPAERRWLLRLERPRDVAALLARSPLIHSTVIDPRNPGELRVVGRDDEALSPIIQGAIVQAGSDVMEMSDLGVVQQSLIQEDAV